MIQKNNIEIYTQYLERAFKNVIENTLKDQSLQILKEMEDKSFFQTRIHELFSQLYCAERQNKIKQLIEQAHTLSSKTNVYTKQRPDPCHTQDRICDHEFLKGNLQQNSPKIQKDEQKTKQYFTLKLMRKENQTLQQEIKSLKQQQLSEVQSLRNVSQLKLKKLENQLEKMKNKYLSLERKYAEEKIFYNKEALTIEKLRKQQFQQQQKYTQLETRFKENENERKRQKEKIEMKIKQLEECRDYALVLESKLNKLQQDKRYMNKKIESYKALISKIESKNEQTLDENLHYQQQLRFQGQQREIQTLLSRLQTKQIELKEQIRQNFILKEEKSKLQKQYKEFKQNALLNIEDMKDNINKTKLQHEKQLNAYQNNEKQNFYSMKQLQINAKLHQIGQQRSKIKELQLEKTQNINKIIQLQFSNQNLTNKYHSLDRSFQQEKSIFQKKIEQLQQKIENNDKKQKQLNKKIKVMQSFYIQLEISLRQKIRLQEQKNQILITQLQREKEEQKKIVFNINEVENKKNRTKILDKMNENLLKQHEMTAKINQLENLLSQNKSTFKELINKKDEKLKKLKEQLEITQQKYTQIALKYSQESQKRENIEKKMTEAEKLMSAQQQKIINLQERARKEMLELIKQRDKKIQQQRVYQEKYYEKLYIHKESLRQNNFNSQDARRFLQQDKQKQAIQSQVSRVKAKNYQFEVKLSQSEKKVKQLEEKMISLIEQCKSMKKKECLTEQNLQMHKNKQIKMVNYYEQKILNCKNLFKEFRFQMCHQFFDAIIELKNQLKQIKKEISKFAQTWKKYILNVSIEISGRIETCLSAMQRKIQNKYKKQNQSQIFRLEKEKEQIIITYQNKLKLKQMDMLTFAAQRQFSMQQVRQNENSLNKKYKELENLHKKAQTKIEKSEKIELQLRNIISKMEMKVDSAQKEYCIKEKQIYQLEQLVDQLREKVQKSENYYKLQLKNCREKYRQQNQRIFNKYQRQFQKMINLNGKINKDKANLSSVSSFKGIFIPTKGNQQDSIQKLKREIQQQRKIVQKMENKIK